MRGLIINAIYYMKSKPEQARLEMIIDTQAEQLIKKTGHLHIDEADIYDYVCAKTALLLKNDDIFTPGDSLTPDGEVVYKLERQYPTLEEIAANIIAMCAETLRRNKELAEGVFFQPE